MVFSGQGDKFVSSRLLMCTTCKHFNNEVINFLNAWGSLWLSCPITADETAFVTSAFLNTTFFGLYCAAAAAASAGRFDLLSCCFPCRACTSLATLTCPPVLTFYFGLDWIYGHCASQFVMLILGIPSEFPCDLDWLLKLQSLSSASFLGISHFIPWHLTLRHCSRFSEIAAEGKQGDGDWAFFLTSFHKWTLQFKKQSTFWSSLRYSVQFDTCFVAE